MILKTLITRHSKKILLRPYSTKNVIKLKDRGLLAGLFPDQSAGEIIDLINGQDQTVYAGFDPTANSLHIGNLLILMKLMHWQRAGQKPVALIGGATALIGDPSGRKEERPILLEADVNNNAEEIANTIRTIFENHERYFCDGLDRAKLHGVKVVNNLQWYGKMAALDFIGKVGRNFRVGHMLGMQSVKNRMESGEGITFTEFTYQMLQAYDWLHLNQDFGCRFQIGGNDQLGNIHAGYDLITKVTNQKVYGLTVPLMKTKEGDKFGKSRRNALWLSHKATSPFEFYQYFMRSEDSDLENLLLAYTFEPIQNIKDVMNAYWKKPEEKLAQKMLAHNVTLLVHGEKGLENAKNLTSIFYENNLEALKSLNIESFEGHCDDGMVVTLILQAGLTVTEASVKAKCFPTEADAVRMITNGAFYINMQKVKNPQEVITTSSHVLPNNISLFRVGKKYYTIVKWAT